MKSFYSEEEFDLKIREIEVSHEKRIIALAKVVEFCRDTLDTYKSKVKKENFKNSNLEVTFFKHLKQVPLTSLFYYHSLQAIELETSEISFEQKLKYYHQKLEEMESFSLKHLQFVHYMELEQNFMDEIYFTRKHNKKAYWQDPFFYLQDFQFSTSHDTILARLRSHQRLSTFLQKALKAASGETAVAGPTGLRWTGQKVDLTELIYALHQNGSINEGNLTLKELVRSFEQFLSIDLGDYHHKFLRLRERKEPVKYLDRLVFQLTAKMKELDN